MERHWKRDIGIFIGSQTLSLFGSMLVQYAIAWHITMTTQSGAMMTISIICGILPTFFVSPFGGVWADRYDRKKLIIFADLAIAMTTLVLAASFMAGYRSLWLLFAASAVRAVGAGIQTPAVGAFLPQIVPRDGLLKVNAVFGSIQSIIMLTAPMAAGALMSFASIEALFFVDVATAALAIGILLAFLRVPPHARALADARPGYWRDLRDGFAYVASHAYLKRFFIFCACFYVLAAPVAVLTPLQVSRSFGNDVWRLTAIEIVFSVGMTIGGVIMASWGGLRNRVHTMAMGTFIVGATTATLGLVPWFWVYLAVMGICGIALPMFNTPATVLLQETVEESYLGRVFGVLGMVSSLAWPLGMVIFGPFADAVRIEWLFVGTGAGIFALGFSLSGSRTMLAIGRAAVFSAVDGEPSAGEAVAEKAASGEASSGEASSGEAG